MATTSFLLANSALPASSLSFSNPRLRPKSLSSLLPNRFLIRRSTEQLPCTFKPVLQIPLLLSPICSLADSHPPNFAKDLPPPFSSISVPAVDFSQITPITVCKWALVASVVVAVIKRTVNFLLSPFFWTYFSFTWLYWPWYVALFVAGYGVYCLRKHLAGESTIFEQLAVVTSAITWLTLVPPAHFNGYLEGWPIAFFFVYHYFFFFEVSVRKRLYGDLQPRPHDPKWDVKLSLIPRLIFSTLVLVGHWLAAFEGPELHLVPGGWLNLGMWVLIMLVLFMRYHSVLYLAKYSEKVVEPSTVVQFGPYRWVRHPIYASTMLLFATYFVALQAPLSLFFTMAVCLIYYGYKAKLEEDLMVDAFGDGYLEYTRKVKYKLIPFLY